MLTKHGSTSISYDEIGNPLNWRGFIDLTWDERSLKSLGLNYGSGVTFDMSFEYNSDGIRTQKTVVDTSTSENYTVKYVLDGSKILRETHINNTTGAVVYTMDFMYDDSGVAGFIYNGTSYYYIKNLQGDILYICNASGNIVVAYTYDAWGNILSTTGSMVGTIGKYNPFRYRGYYYDSEIALYYLNSRFYDPQVGRFINADGIVGANGGLQGYNMFAYCNNNPVMGYDPTGEYDANSRLLSHVGVKDAIGTSLIIGVGGAIILSSSDILVEPIEGLIDDIRTTLKKAKEQIKEKVKDIAESLPKPPKFHVHHIVAKADPRAAEARQILYDVGINPWLDPRNLVVLPQSYHASLHTTAYYEYITERLRLVAGDKAGVEATLASLKVEILARSVAGIRWE